MFISSTGGHLSELLKLEPLFAAYDFCLVTERIGPVSNELVSRFPGRVHFLAYGTSANLLSYPFKLAFNTLKSLWLLLRLRPQYIVSTGAHTAGPMCLFGHWLGAKIIFIETFANIQTTTGTGSRVYRFADLFLVQHPEMLELYPKAVYVGGVF